MRSGKDEPTDLSILHQKLTDAGIEHEYREHPVAKAEPQVLGLIGYFPSGTHQIIIDTPTDKISIIRGSVSFGDFELYSLGGGKWDADRFYTEDEVIEALKNL